MDALWILIGRSVGLRSILIAVVILHVGVQGILSSEGLITAGFLAGDGPVLPGS